MARISLLPTVYDLEYMIDLAQKRLLADVIAKRAIKEALYIRRNNPSLNKNIGKYHLPHIWDEVLVNITELQLI